MIDFIKMHEKQVMVEEVSLPGDVKSFIQWVDLPEEMAVMVVPFILP